MPASPTISDDEPISINRPPWALPIHLCAPDSVWIWGGNFAPTDNISWHLGQGPGGPLITTNDSLMCGLRDGTIRCIEYLGMPTSQ